MDAKVDLLEFLRQQRVPEGADVSDTSCKHWRLVKQGRNRWLYLDCEGVTINTLNEEVLAELDSLLAGVEKDLPDTLVITSGKAKGFCAGADINMFHAVSKEDVSQKLTKAHAITDRLANLPCNTVALISGACLGGGLELALACKQRIAVVNATFGFPEVLIGLHPGLGGTFRSTALINPLEAMKLMLTGRTITARQAKRLGLVDVVTEERHTRAVIDAVCANQVPRWQRPKWQSALAWKGIRTIVGKLLTNATRKRVTPDHYPSPFALIRLWERFGGDPRGMQQQEIKSFARLVASTSGQNLIRVFNLREHLRHQESSNVKQINRVHLVGAGTMGGDIAGWCAYRGLTVTLSDFQMPMIASAVKRLSELCQRKHLTPRKTRECHDRLIPDPKGIGYRRADLVIEAVPEKVSIKESVLQALESSSEILLATNTSSIPLEELRASTGNPSRFLGLHFFNPVAQMQLLEVVVHDQLSDDALSKALAFTRQIDRLPVVVKSSPGFLVNRVLTPYLLEAMLLVDEGVQAEVVDQCAEVFGMPMGPIELADRVGLDICLSVADLLTEQLESPLPQVPDWLRDKVNAGKIGKKSGSGLYQWHKSKADKKPVKAEAGDATDRMVLTLLNMAVACLREGVVEDEKSLDAAMIFGTGFAPFRGGPLHYAKQRGVNEIVATLERFSNKYGPRFAPDPGWQQRKA